MFNSQMVSTPKARARAQNVLVLETPCLTPSGAQALPPELQWLSVCPES